MKSIGFVGLGAMGSPMAANLIGKGFALRVHNRTRSREEPLASMGAARADSPKEAARGADLVITVVSDTPDVEEVLFGDQGVAEGVAPGSVVIDMSTIDPDAAADFAGRFQKMGVGFLDAPVSGGTEGAASGTLSIMCGGDARTFAQAEPVLSALGSTITLVGEPGSGQMTKAINQVIIADTFLAVAEGIRLGITADLDMGAVVKAVRAGSAGSWVLENRASRMIDGEFPLGFKVSLHRKDLRIVLAVCERLGIRLRATEMVAQMEDALIEMGRGDEDMSAISIVTGGVTGPKG